MATALEPSTNSCTILPLYPYKRTAARPSPPTQQQLATTQQTKACSQSFLSKILVNLNFFFSSLDFVLKRKMMSRSATRVARSVLTHVGPRYFSTAVSRGGAASDAAALCGYVHGGAATFFHGPAKGPEKVVVTWMRFPVLGRVTPVHWLWVRSRRRRRRRRCRRDRMVAPPLVVVGMVIRRL
ncbi:UNVERIFIED_CONTAM: Ubiquinol oxidase 1, mitochondrial [Sesamum latifolium]|uniref:Ubiquinol oxidase 1, mitochondrial n=1 Tax=Sesamum latifolium TaxID=2727402 RepID=A0AAW2SMJ3_9LAMI